MKLAGNMLSPRIATEHRRIVTQIPHPASGAIAKKIRGYEPRSTDMVAPIVWDRAQGYQVFDGHGNCWIDFTSGIYVANVGHAHPDVCDALMKQIENKQLHSYLFATEVRARLLEKLVSISPVNLTKALLLSTGSEATECAIKLARLYGLSVDAQKTVVVSFQGSFHGRTMGSQMLSSNSEHRSWITNPDPDIQQIPFPDEECGAEVFAKNLEQLRAKGVAPQRIAAFVLESYQGQGGPLFYPTPYIQAMRQWANEHQTLMIFDEIQAAFGRTGKLFGFEHYGVEPDLICCGKGISSCLPLSAVIGPAEILDIPNPGSLSSTHLANPLCCAAALASIEVLEREGLVERAARLETIFRSELLKIQTERPGRISHVRGRGMVHAIFFVNPKTGEADETMAKRVTDRAIQKGLMLFYTLGDSIKMGPPLIIPDQALREGLQVLREAVNECLAVSR